MITRTAALLLTSLLLTACETTTNHTPSGRPEITVQLPPDVIQSRVINHLVDNGYTIRSTNPRQTVLELPITNVAQQILYGATSSNSLVARVTVDLVPRPPDTRLLLNLQVVTHPGKNHETIRDQNQTPDALRLQSLLHTLFPEAATD